MKKVILLVYQNNCKTLKPLLEYQDFLQYYSLFLRFQQNYFDDLTKFSDVSGKILDLSAKSFFSCKDYNNSHMNGVII